MHHPTDRITHTTAFVTPVAEHWLEPARRKVGISITSSRAVFVKLKLYPEVVRVDLEGREEMLYGVRHMVKDHSDSERGNPLPPHGLRFSINNKGSFICTIPQTG